MSAHSIAQPESRPRLTVVVSCRQRHDLTEAAIDAVVRNTRIPMRLLWVDVCAPDWLRARIARRASGWKLEVVRFDEPLLPTQALKRVVESIETPYAVFLDNDVVIHPGCLDYMVDCAEQTGAGIVGPVYLWGTNVQTDRIHMAGGDLTAERIEGGFVLREHHRHLNRKLGEAELCREECGFVEFHCMLMRREIFRDPAIFDDGIVCVHEHIHASLVARAKGRKTYLEPEARATYLAFAPYALADIPVFRRRWAHEAAESSIRAFVERWGVVDDERSFGGIRNFLTCHRSSIDPLRASLQNETITRAPMQDGDLKQDLAHLIEQARSMGYGIGDLDGIKQAHAVALVFSDGGYRPCGRPFIDHLVGAASVLVHYGFEIRLVQAALLHAAYSHAPHFYGGPQATVEGVMLSLGGRDHPVERAVRAYTLRTMRWPALSDLNDWQNTATMTDIDTAILAIANAIDMHLSGEVRATGRDDIGDKAALMKARDICDILGVPGLAETALSQPQAIAKAPVSDGQPIASFRMDGACRVPMVNSAFFQIRDSAGAGAR